MAKILVVEDNPIIQKILTMQLEQKQHEVIVAHDGATAVAQAQAHVPDLILMDMRLPGMDGGEATARIKAQDTTAHIPIVAQTAAVSIEEHQRLYAAGCTAVLVKPVKLDKLQAVLDELLD